MQLMWFFVAGAMLASVSYWPALARRVPIALYNFRPSADLRRPPGYVPPDDPNCFVTLMQCVALAITGITFGATAGLSSLAGYVVMSWVAFKSTRQRDGEEHVGRQSAFE